MAEHVEGANTVGTSVPPQWALDLQCACEELKRVQGRELEDDQWALKAALERIYGGLEQAPPVQAFPVPDVVLLPMQTASVHNYVSGTQEFQPTASAVSAAAREAFRALKVKPELKGMESELRGLADSLRGAPASPRDPEAMAKHARYPGLDPKLPFALEPPRPTTEGHLPRLNLHALATMHLAAQNYLATMIYGGVFDRHPGLRIGVIELGAMWVGPFVDLLEDRLQLSRRLRESLQRSPREVFIDQIRVTPFFWERTARQIERYGMPEIYAFSTDFPHPEGGTDPIGKMAADITPLGDEALEAFFVRNAELLLPA